MPDVRLAPTPDRNCDGCTLCCKVLAIEELNKPQGTWCVHCERTSGCRIYQDRPDPCRNFRCLFLLAPQMPEAWRPKNAHFVIVTESTGRLVAVHCDPQWPRAWRDEPYYSYFKRWSAELMERAAVIAIYVGKRVTAVLPDRDIDLGVIDGKSL